jgi:23S rRNA (pseudouridine1915-N3)-methyltransferase
VEMVYLPTIKSAGSFSPGEIKAKEFEQFSKHLGKGTIVALDMHGRKMDSPAFARFIDGCQSNTKGQITFLIGGAHGLDERLLKSTGAAISLSPLTFSHQLVRLVFLEQLYRAFSILHGTPYHK